MELREHTIQELNEAILEANNSGEFIDCVNGPNNIGESIDGFKDSKDFHIFGLYDSNELIGFTTTFPNKTEGRISIGYTYIRPIFRGKGYGIEMLNLLIDWIKGKGFKEVFNKTWSSNIPVIKLNEKAGFKLIEQVKNDRKNGDSTLKYLLKL